MIYLKSATAVTILWDIICEQTNYSLIQDYHILSKNTNYSGGIRAFACNLLYEFNFAQIDINIRVL